MGRTLTRTRLIVSTLMMVVGVGIFISLGTWQLQRKQWKEDLLQKLSLREDHSALSIDSLLNLSSNEIKSREFAVLKVDALALPIFVKVGPKIWKSQNGYHLYQLFQISAHSSFWVNLGWVPSHWQQDTDQSEKENVNLLVRLRWPQKPNLFTPSNLPQEGKWFWPEVAQMNLLFAPHALPFYGELLNASPVRFSPASEALERTLENRHLEYAITWFILGGLLLGIYLYFLKSLTYVKIAKK